MTQQLDRGGPCVSERTVRREVARVMNRSANQLAHSILAKAIQGDPTSQLAAVQLLNIGLNREPSK